MVESEIELSKITNASNIKELKNIIKYGLKFDSNHANYFLNVGKNYMFQPKDESRKKVGIIGFNIPEEIITACGAKPVWILGGSFDCASYADSISARDTDPMAKAILGMITSESFSTFKDIDLMVIPLISDSMRKIAYMLSKRFKVFLIDVPPIKESEFSYKKWKNQLAKLTDVISSITGKKMTKESLMSASYLIKDAKFQVKRFTNNHKKYENLLSNSFYSLIVNSYFMTHNLDEWTGHLRELNKEIESISNYEIESIKNKELRPNILVTGSSVFFPNFKMPNLLDDAGLNSAHTETEITAYLSIIPEIKGKILKSDIFKTIINTYYARSTSQAFTNNKTLLKALENEMKQSNIDGVVYHVIRGQVSCDFEFESVENLLIKYDIPILRLETDYNYQDIEQLRIRLEAFSEMIKAKLVVNKSNIQQNNEEEEGEYLSLNWRRTS